MKKITKILFATVCSVLLIPCCKVEAKNLNLEPIKYIDYGDADCNIFVYTTMIADISLAKEDYSYAKDYIDEYNEDKASKYDKIVYKKIKEIVNREDDVNLLSHLIYSENGTEGYDCMYGTGSVAINRVNFKYYPDTLYDVVYQEGQYAVTFDGAINKEPSKEAYDIARDLIMNGTNYPSDVVFQAEFTQGSEIYRHISNTYFCRW